MRGLKHFSLDRKHHGHVASFTDAWIETVKVYIYSLNNSVASFTDAWIETNMSIEFNAGLQSHLLQMRGLKPKNEYGYETLRSRIFYRCVD